VTECNDDVTCQKFSRRDNFNFVNFLRSTILSPGRKNSPPHKNWKNLNFEISAPDAKSCPRTDFLASPINLRFMVAVQISRPDEKSAVFASGRGNLDFLWRSGNLAGDRIPSFGAQDAKTEIWSSNLDLELEVQICRFPGSGARSSRSADFPDLELQVQICRFPDPSQDALLRGPDLRSGPKNHVLE